MNTLNGFLLGIIISYMVFKTIEKYKSYVDKKKIKKQKLQTEKLIIYVNNNDRVTALTQILFTASILAMVECIKNKNVKPTIKEPVYSKEKTICFSSNDDLEELQDKLTIGKEYLFSDCLQEEKTFKVEWKKGILEKIERHSNSINCFVTGNEYFFYIKEI